MRISVLAENTAVSPEFEVEHGLSLYIETKKHKLLFDTGASELFWRNALRMKVDLSEVDMVVISHGHYDHGGGILKFLEVNKKAKLYIHNRAFGDYFSNRPGGLKYIGLDKTLKTSERIVFCGDSYKIDEELELFSDVKARELFSLSNKNLLMKSGKDFAEDSFLHEQDLIIKEDGRCILLAGCAHNGIVNIQEKFRELKGKYADVVIGGFHLYNPSSGKSECPDLIGAIGERLINTNSVYYTCHCTGLEAYGHLKTVLGEKINYLATGEAVSI